VDRYQWLLFLHVAGAFFLIGGIVIAGVFNLAALRRERPSEIATLLGLTRLAVVCIGIGMLATLGFGLWLVHHVGYGWGDAWIIAALVLWALAGFLGGRGGRYEREARELAERLAAEGDAPNEELRAKLHDPKALALSWSSGLVAFAVLGLMIWKPGA
jgi:uncharacterized membrane protein